MLLKIKSLFKREKYRNIDEYDIDEKEMNRVLSEGAILVDVRSPQEYEEGHMEGAILLQEYEIKKRANELLPNKDKVIVVYCSSGGRSKKAQKELLDMGYKKVYNLYNGYQNYWDLIIFMVKFFYNKLKTEEIWDKKI